MVKNQLLSKGENPSIVPVPRAISSSCGYAIEMKDPKITSIKEVLDQTNEDFGAVFKYSRTGKSVLYEKVPDVDKG